MNALTRAILATNPLANALIAQDHEAPAAPVAKSKGTRALKGKKAKGRGKAKRPKQPKIVKERVPRVPREKVPPFVMPEQASAHLKSVGLLLRKSADSVFDIGLELVGAQQLIPEKSWGKAIKPLGLTTRSAYNYMSVARNLTDYRFNLVQADMVPTVMYQLARCPAVVDEVIAAYQRGDRLSVASVRRIVDAALGVHPKPVTAALDVGGLSGLRRAAAAKLKTDLAEFTRLTRSVLAAVQAAMDAARSKRVKKGPLADLIVHDCRHARDLVNAIAAPLSVTSAAARLSPGQLSGTSGWGKVQALLEQLGSEQTWPAAEALDVWLTEEVVPMLRFVAHGEAMPIAANAAGVNAGEGDTAGVGGLYLQGIVPRASEPETAIEFSPVAELVLADEDVPAIVAPPMPVRTTPRLILPNLA